MLNVVGKVAPKHWRTKQAKMRRSISPGTTIAVALLLSASSSGVAATDELAESEPSLQRAARPPLDSANAGDVTLRIPKSVIALSSATLAAKAAAPTAVSSLNSGIPLPSATSAVTA
eukprot:1830822-Prymnesium_polylepis.1